MDNGENELKKVAVVGHIDHGKTTVTAQEIEKLKVVSAEIESSITPTTPDTSVNYEFTNPYNWEREQRLSRREIREQQRNLAKGKSAGYKRDNNRKKKKRKKR